MSSQPIEYRELLAEVFAEAERKGFGTFSPGFTVHPHADNDAAAADFIEARCAHLSEQRFD